MERDHGKVNRYFGGKGPADVPFKEFELGVTTDSFRAPNKAIWNGGDGLSWIVERPKCLLKFHQKHVGDFLRNNPPAQVAPLPPHHL